MFLFYFIFWLGIGRVIWDFFGGWLIDLVKVELILVEIFYWELEVFFYVIVEIIFFNDGGWVVNSFFFN